MSETNEVQVQVEQISETACRGTARSHRVVMDRPKAKGGDDKGPMGGENLLMSLGGCFMSNLLAAGQARDTKLEQIRLEIKGKLSASPARFSRIIMTVISPNSGGRDLEKLVTIAERGCIVANTLKQGLQVDVKIG